MNLLLKFDIIGGILFRLKALWLKGNFISVLTSSSIFRLTSLFLNFTEEVDCRIVSRKVYGCLLLAWTYEESQDVYGFTVVFTFRFKACSFLKSSTDDYCTELINLFWYFKSCLASFMRCLSLLFFSRLRWWSDSDILEAFFDLTALELARLEETLDFSEDGLSSITFRFGFWSRFTVAKDAVTMGLR